MKINRVIIWICSLICFIYFAYCFLLYKCHPDRYCLGHISSVRYYSKCCIRHYQHCFLKKLGKLFEVFMLCNLFWEESLWILCLIPGTAVWLKAKHMVPALWAEILKLAGTIVAHSASSSAISVLNFRD